MFTFVILLYDIIKTTFYEHPSRLADLSAPQTIIENWQEQHAWAIIKEIFESFGPDGPKDCAWYTLVTALGNDSEEVLAKHRTTMIFFYECSTALFSAIYTLHLRRQLPAPGKKKNKLSRTR